MVIPTHDPFLSCPPPLGVSLRAIDRLRLSQEYKKTFLAQGKPVFNVEYDGEKSVCDEANALGLDTILKVRLLLLLCQRLF